MAFSIRECRPMPLQVVLHLKKSAIQKQIEANQKNAQKSMGPKSDDGKAVVAKNAVRHGILSEQVLVDEEEMYQYKKFYEAMQCKLDPKDVLQGFLVDRIISSAWRLKRVVHVETLTLQISESSFCSNTYRDAFAGSSVTSMAVLSRYERSLENALFRALNELKALKEQDDIEICGIPL